MTNIYLEEDEGMIKSPWAWRRLHLWTVMCDLWRNQPTSASEIARRLGASLPTISQLLKHLIEGGVVIRAGQKKVRGGRPRNLLRIDPEVAHVLVVDVNARSVSTALVNASLKIVTKRERKGLTRISDIVESLLKDFEELELNRRKGKLVGISVVLPCASENSGETDPDVLFNFHSAKLGELLERRLKTRVIVVNGVKVYTMGEWLRARHIPWDYFHLHLGRILSGALMLNGHIHEMDENDVAKINRMVYAMEAGNDHGLIRFEEEYEKALCAVEAGEKEGKAHLVNLLAVAVTNITALIGIKHVTLGGPYSKLLELNDMIEIEKRVWETCQEHIATIEKSSSEEEAPFIGGAVKIFKETLLSIAR